MAVVPSCRPRRLAELFVLLATFLPPPVPPSGLVPDIRDQAPNAIESNTRPECVRFFVCTFKRTPKAFFSSKLLLRKILHGGRRRRRRHRRRRCRHRRWRALRGRWINGGMQRHRRRRRRPTKGSFDKKGERLSRLRERMEGRERPRWVRFKILEILWMA